MTLLIEVVPHFERELWAHWFCLH